MGAGPIAGLNTLKAWFSLLAWWRVFKLINQNSIFSDIESQALIFTQDLLCPFFGLVLCNFVF
jgi:hypothetical protein